MKKLLILLLCFTSITCTISGIVLVINASGNWLGLPSVILEKTMFRDFFIPDMILTAVGSAHMATVVLLMKNNRRQYKAAVAAGSLIGGWIIGQLLLIGNFNWLHFMYIVASLFIILMAVQLNDKWSI